ncbi:MAG TPA: CHAT domain-containing protein [Kofleriaceae bacterium]|nr:CHAT domain-containing protein [Kofleriaceae bacterium]
MAGGELKGPAVFEWSERQRKDLEALWRDPASDGARMRLGGDLAAFGGKLGWSPDAVELEKAEASGEEYMVTISAAPPELYVLPWEVTHVGAQRTHLSSFASAQVRYAVPGLEPREVQPAPPRPGVLFAWSAAGGTVPHDDQIAAIRAAAERGEVEVEEIAGVDASTLQAALDAGPPSVLHLLCHGVPGAPGEPSRLVWGADLDHRSEITATALAEMLRRHHDAIRLVVLSACGSGDGRGDPLFMSSIAQELHRKGIPNVVASRYPLSVSGSSVMTRALYGKMLDEAWSLERALRHARAELFRVDGAGESHAGDAYGLQLYAHDTERFRSDNDAFAERPVLASYPFGTPARPVPAREPPPTELTLAVEKQPELTSEQLAAKLREVSEDDKLTIAIQTGKGKGAVSLIVHTTVDGAQRLLGARRSKVLQIILGVAIVQLILTKGAKLAGAATLHAGQQAASSSAAGQGAGAAGQGAAAGKISGALGRVGLRGLRSIAVRALGAKLAAMLVVGGAAIVGGVTMYRAQGEADARPAGSTDAGTDAGTDAPVGVAGSDAPGDVVSGGGGQTGGQTGGGAPPSGTTSTTSTDKPPSNRPAPSPGGTPASAEHGQDHGTSPASHPPSRPPAHPPVSQPVPSMPPAGSTPDVPAAGSADPGDPAGTDPETPAENPNRAPPTPEPVGDAPSTGSDGQPGSAKGTEVEPGVLEANFQSGDRAPMPDPETIRMMRRDHLRDLEGEVRLCTTSRGDVSTAWTSQTTGYPRYDETLLAAVRRWHYRPRTVNGADVPMCSSAHFKYSNE